MQIASRNFSTSKAYTLGVRETAIFKANLRRLFAESGWTMVELSKRAKISRAQLIAVMRDESTLSMERAESVANAFGLSFRDMLSESVPDAERAEEDRLARLYRHSPKQAQTALMALAEMSAREVTDKDA